MLTNPATRWLILGWCTLTIMFAFAIPTFALPVLFFEMAADLDLDILQLGVVWGTMSLTAMVIGLVGGTLGDRFGTRRTIGVACLLTGMFGALRGAVPSYGLLVVSFLLYGLIAPGIPPNVHKTGASFFPKRRGLSAGTISVGMALALFIGVRFSATGLSPWIGGWRNVLFLYGAISATFGLIWLFIVPDSIMPAVAKKHTPMMESLRHIIQLPELWIIGIGALVFWGCYRGFIGYLPTYLRNVGWTATDADNTLSLLYLSSLILVLPLSMLSDRFNNRKFFMVASLLLMGLGGAMLGLGNLALVTMSVVLVGAAFGAFMSIHQAAVIDAKGVGGTYAGTALGFNLMLREFGGTVEPPIGNYLERFTPSMPFIFWGVLALCGAVVYLWLPQRQLKDLQLSR